MGERESLRMRRKASRCIAGFCESERWRGASTQTDKWDMQIPSGEEIKENYGRALTVAASIPAISRGYKLYKAMRL